MATEKEANRAREQYAELLRERGAHAISVENTDEPTAFAVIAFFDKKPRNLPRALKITTRKGTREVPVVARIAERFKPE